MNCVLYNHDTKSKRSHTWAQYTQYCSKDSEDIGNTTEYNKKVAYGQAEGVFGHPVYPESQRSDGTAKER
jgi:hypothetical protein